MLKAQFSVQKICYEDRSYVGSCQAMGVRLPFFSWSPAFSFQNAVLQYTVEVHIKLFFFVLQWFRMHTVTDFSRGDFMFLSSCLWGKPSGRVVAISIDDLHCFGVNFSFDHRSVWHSPDGVR